MSIIKKFQSSAATHAGNNALREEGEVTSYRKLEQQALSLTSGILHGDEEGGANRPPIAALLLGNGAKAIAAVLGVLQAGGSYVPLDSLHPVQRLAYILNDSGAEMLITDKDHLELAYRITHAARRSIRVLDLEELYAAEIAGGDIAAARPLPAPNRYAAILYTSGSTGLPKKVMVEADEVTETAEYFVSKLGIGPSDTLMLTTSLSHAVSLLDVFGCLFAGACVVPYNVKENFQREDFLSRIGECGATILHTVPTFFRYLTDDPSAMEVLGSVRLVLLGGEEVTPDDLRRFVRYFGREARIANLYGQTELLLATLHLLDRKAADGGEVLNIGYPIPLVDADIRDERGNSLGVMGQGELILNRHRDGVAVHTGDIGRWLPDGSIDYIGRKDYQYKINGNRVHATEIEKAIKAMSGIGDCIVMMTEQEGRQQLTAFYTRALSASLVPTDVRNILRGTLPGYMVPQMLFDLDAFPLLPNGKVDREALTRTVSRNEGGAEVAGDDAAIEKLTAIWKNVLKTDTIGRNDNFFLLGGNSLHATEIISHIYLTFQIELQTSVLFDNQTIAELAKALETRVQAVNY